MSELPREARWSLAASVALGLLLAGLGAGALVGSVAAPDEQADSQAVHGIAPYGSQAGYFSGSATVTRDLQVRGVTIGTSAILAVYTGGGSLYRGSAVRLTGVVTLEDGTVVPSVSLARRDGPVIGVVDRKVVLVPYPRVVTSASASATAVASSSATPDPSASVAWSPAPEMALAPEGFLVEPGDLLTVVTSGVAKFVTVSASEGPITTGTPLAVGSSPGQLVAAGPEQPPGTILAYALGDVMVGEQRIPVLVQIH